jgi:hypothetical protein
LPQAGANPIRREGAGSGAIQSSHQALGCSSSDIRHSLRLSSLYIKHIKLVFTAELGGRPLVHLNGFKGPNSTFLLTTNPAKRAVGERNDLWRVDRRAPRLGAVGNTRSCSRPRGRNRLKTNGLAAAQIVGKHIKFRPWWLDFERDSSLITPPQKRTARKRPQSREETPKEGMRRICAGFVIVLCGAQSARANQTFPHNSLSAMHAAGRRAAVSLVAA